MNKPAIDLNVLLRIANVLMAALVVYGWSRLDNNPYVDGNSILLGLALCLQTHAALRFERRHRDPFVILVALWMILFYEMRVFSLSMLPFSAVFNRFEYGAADTNYALIFILIANLFLYGGFAAARLRAGPVSSTDWRASAPLRVVFVMCMSLALTYLTGQYWSEGNVPRGMNFLVLYFSPAALVLMALIYFFLFRRTLSFAFVATIGILVLTDIVTHTLQGSRSAMVVFAQTCLLVLLAIYGSIKFSRRFVTIGVVSLPLVAVVLVAAFAVSTYIRTARAVSGVDLGVGVEMARESSEKLTGAGATELILSGVASRIGYLDFSAEVIAHKSLYAPVVKPAAYGRSIVDNLLTPGIDLFDQPKIANSLLFVYSGLGPPSKQLVGDYYQSDQLGIYGEFYLLAGWAALPFMFLVAFAFKRLFDRVYSQNPLTLVLLRVIVLFAFMRLLDSFGIDWVINETVPLVAAVFLYSFFFAAHRLRSRAADAPKLQS